MATTLEYLQSIATTAVEAQDALERKNIDEFWNLLGSIRNDLNAIMDKPLDAGVTTEM